MEYHYLRWIRGVSQLPKKAMSPLASLMGVILPAFLAARGYAAC